MSPAVVNALIAAAKIAPGAMSLASKLGAAKYEELIVEYFQCFGAHQSSSYERCANIKNIVYRDQSVRLREKYVNIYLEKNEDRITDNDVLKSVLNGGRVAVSGTAGAGKTMFLKYSTLELIDSIENHQLITLFLELRYVGEEDIQNGLVPCLLKHTSHAKDRVTQARFEAGLEAGLFVILLDAVDEVNPRFRGKVIDAIRQFLRDYPLCPLIVTTRPDPGFESIQDLQVYRTTKMDKDQITTVISKLDYDENVKTKLIERLQGGLFEEQAPFLSNPLLATIMLLAYDHSADIPSKITSFYKLAFETLYQRHDAAKGVYKRGHHAGLPLDEFERVFSAFCYQTYQKAKYEFSYSELLTFTRKSLEYIGLQAKAEDVVQDMVESVCLIQPEGLDFTFVHRSFQEYFCAVFISRYSGDDVFGVIDAAVDTFQSENMLAMLEELNPGYVDGKWLLPQINRYLKATSSMDPKTPDGLARLFKATLDSLNASPRSGEIRSISIGGKNASEWLVPMERYESERDLLSVFFNKGEKTLREQLTDSLTHTTGETRDLILNLVDKLKPLRYHEDDDDNGDDESPHGVVSIDENDAIALVSTHIPDCFIEFRQRVMDLRDEIKQAQTKRKESMKMLILR